MKTDRLVFQRKRSRKHWEALAQWSRLSFEESRTHRNRSAANITIYLVLPLLCAYRAIVRGWAEPHYLRSQGLMPAGTVVVYTPKDVEELAICSVLFSESYHLGRKSD
jgi:hypothetical protein